jgi:hypothetical protein
VVGQLSLEPRYCARSVRSFLNDGSASEVSRCEGTRGCTKANRRQNPAGGHQSGLEGARPLPTSLHSGGGAGKPHSAWQAPRAQFKSWLTSPSGCEGSVPDCVTQVAVAGLQPLAFSICTPHACV